MVPETGPTVQGVTRRVEVDNLVGAAEIAQRLNLRLAQTVHDWRRRHPSFPQPIARLSMGLLWNWPDVERWARRTGRLPRRDTPMTQEGE
jgi:hypothetical protein